MSRTAMDFIYYLLPIVRKQKQYAMRDISQRSCSISDYGMVVNYRY
jgi:hypothetical protein